MNAKQIFLHHLIQDRIFIRGDIVWLLGMLAQNEEVLKRTEFRLSTYGCVQSLVLTRPPTPCFYRIARNDGEITSYNGRGIWELLQTHFTLPLYIVVQYDGWERDPNLLRLVHMLHTDRDPESELLDTERISIHDWLDTLTEDTTEIYKRVMVERLGEMIDAALAKRDFQEVQRLLSQQKQLLGE